MPGFNMLIIDSNNDFSRATCQFMIKNTDIIEIETCNEANKATKIINRLKPDFILIELKLLDKSESFFNNQLRIHAPGVIIIGLTLFNTHHHNCCPGFLRSKGVDAIVSRVHFANEIVKTINYFSSETNE